LNSQLGGPSAVTGSTHGIYFASAHLENNTTPEFRKMQIAGIIADSGPRSIIGGDMNLILSHHFWPEQAERYMWQQGFEDPFRKARGTLNRKDADWVRLLGFTSNIDRLISKGVTLKDCRVHDKVKASDHYPISAIYTV